jgi:methylated-DNA-[protein]-cysteine S-methyltransferase
MPHLSLNSPVGPLTLFEDDGALVSIEWGRAPAYAAEAASARRRPDGAETPLLCDARLQLYRYFDRALEVFDLPLRPAGSGFEREVWTHMAAIPYGHTWTYGQLAKIVNSDARAIGTACGRNPIPIVIPCHRVVGADGKMTGYSGGAGIETKTALLALEGAVLL